jgi:hypothetical protein
LKRIFSAETRRKNKWAIVNEFPIYFNLIELGFRHKTVNMSVEFVSDGGIQTNMIGGFSTLRVFLSINPNIVSSWSLALPFANFLFHGCFFQSSRSRNLLMADIYPP